MSEEVGVGAPAFQMVPGSAGKAGSVALGVVGGGQLGRMFVHAAQSLGYVTAVLDPDPASPAGLVAHHHVCAGYDDDAGLEQLQRLCDAVTIEFENVPADALLRLSRSIPTAPDAQAVAICQDRAQEKEQFMRCQVPCAPHAVIATAGDIFAVNKDLLPGILKTSRLGYDGKGQVRVADVTELGAGWDKLGNVVCVLEKLLPLQEELSVVVARACDGTLVHLPVQHNLHRDGILAVTTVPMAETPIALHQRAVEAASAVALALDYVGVLCVEFFVLHDGTLIANEMAPRPHNSGHYSIDACDVSQFELQVRCMAGLPLPMPRQHSSAVMLNLLGDLWFDAKGQELLPPWEQILALPGVHLHLYGKAQARRGRKMGHLTLTASALGPARAAAAQAARILGLAPF